MRLLLLTGFCSSPIEQFERILHADGRLSPSADVANCTSPGLQDVIHHHAGNFTEDFLTFLDRCQSGAQTDPVGLQQGSNGAKQRAETGDMRHVMFTLRPGEEAEWLPEDDSGRRPPEYHAIDSVQQSVVAGTVFVDVDRKAHTTTEVCALLVKSPGCSETFCELLQRTMFENTTPGRMGRGGARAM